MRLGWREIPDRAQRRLPLRILQIVDDLPRCNLVFVFGHSTPERGASGAEIEAEAERHVVEAGLYVEQMIKLPATTWPGLYAKARAVAWCLGGDD
ncbi:MAG: hypothetical protein ACXW35_09610, partial [Nitrospira sp.]